MGCGRRDDASEGRPQPCGLALGLRLAAAGACQLSAANQLGLKPSLGPVLRSSARPPRNSPQAAGSTNSARRWLGALVVLAFVGFVGWQTQLDVAAGHLGAGAMAGEGERGGDGDEDV